MIPRAYDVSRDTELIKGKDIDPARDIIVIVEVEGRAVEVVALRPCLFVHDFELSGGLLKRQITDCAMAYAMGAARAMGHREAIVVVDEDKTRMRTWWEEHGATMQEPGVIYMMEIR
jgi:hypothetical protein